MYLVDSERMLGNQGGVRIRTSALVPGANTSYSIIGLVLPPYLSGVEQS